MLTLRDLSVRLDGKQILDGVSFTLRPHTLTALVGRNGSGKSTLLACVNRQLPYTGQILADERDLARLSSRERAKLVAILPQNLPAPHITGYQMAAFGRNPYLDLTGRLSPDDRRAVEQALQDAKAEDFRERYVDTLSGGEGQRVALAMILAQNTPIALLDEPTAHMDQQFEAAFLHHLSRLKTQRQKTFLVVLHDLTQAVRWADDLIVLDGGKLVFSGTTQECLQQEILEKTFSLRRYTFTEAGEERYFFSADHGRDKPRMDTCREGQDAVK